MIPEPGPHGAANGHPLGPIKLTGSPRVRKNHDPTQGPVWPVIPPPATGWVQRSGLGIGTMQPTPTDPNVLRLTCRPTTNGEYAAWTRPLATPPVFDVAIGFDDVFIERTNFQFVSLLMFDRVNVAVKALSFAFDTTNPNYSLSYNWGLERDTTDTTNAWIAPFRYPLMSGWPAWSMLLDDVKWLRIRQDSTNRYYYAASSGVSGTHWVQLGAPESNTAYLTPTDVGVGLCAERARISGGDGLTDTPIIIRLIHWSGA